jgi:hypothetical protein
MTISAIMNIAIDLRQKNLTTPSPPTPIFSDRVWFTGKLPHVGKSKIL